MTKIYPLIICGGNGTRLWPISRTQSPKQFQKVGDADSLTFFQSTVERHRGEDFADPIVVTSVRHRKVVHEQLDEIGVQAEVILEPMGRNTGPAVLAAALTKIADDPDALLLVLPADHVIRGDLNTTITAMRGAALDGYIITFGIKPRFAETGFGYIVDDGPIVGHNGLRMVERFVEKPPARKARQLVESDIAYWASGISMFSAKTIIEEYTQFDPATVEAVRKSVELADEREDGLMLNAIRFSEAGNLPTEQAVFEKTSRISLAPLDIDWSDVGSWSAMYGISDTDHLGNVLQGDAIAVETQNSMVRSDGRRLVTLVGMKDTIVIDTPDALLVTQVGHCQSVKKVAEFLKEEKRLEAERHVGKEHEDGLTRLIASDHVNVAEAKIQPGKSLEIAKGNGREVIVVRGQVIFGSDDAAQTYQEGQRFALSETEASTLRNKTGKTAELLFLNVQAPVEHDASKVLSLKNYA
ncbi:mannose-1-phosphate guanylyltransferase [Pseudoprimorskyibacter insulae]|uniref:Alginate biosynthesis protein AlgA n=1 Tax=Pseudoprimorskyibacter insulae TaxID=1695997 RepID=A0A2R8API3_9RHOB|nr:sugar phosphate nucleotidyltransferase [Pseudoprimorskyibacter insulae]SPF77988.1 Alginate biosynthesis protein AlgA [Pseudoprimorskyibacter insulae]